MLSSRVYSSLNTSSFKSKKKKNALGSATVPTKFTSAMHTYNNLFNLHR